MPVSVDRQEDRQEGLHLALADIAITGDVNAVKKRSTTAPT